MSNKRKLYLDICDYKRNPIYSLYDNDVRTIGQAYNIIVSTERNGWRELSFSIPSVCQTESGEEPNEALDYLKADFFIRLIDDTETDWFVISEPKVTHSGFSKTVNVTAGHISQQLRVKNLGLEFSDSEGNNVGTAAQLLDTILEGTGWTAGYVHDFKEKRTGTTKVRSLKASTKTGAFKLISTMCDLFEAKPVYHGDTKTVDIVPINPFANYAKGSLPELTYASGVIELHYGKNIKNVTRSMNSENIVTKLYAYGSFGDKTNGYCAIDQCTHTEYRFAVTQTLIKGQWYYFTVEDDSGEKITYRFKAISPVRENGTTTDPVREGNTLVFSLMDPSSMLYIWCETGTSSLDFAMPVYKGQESGDTNLIYDATDNPAGRATVTKEEDVRNWFSFLMDFDYYRETGIMTDDMVQKLALYQRYAPILFENIQQAASSMADKQTDLAKLFGSVDFCKLSVKEIGENGQYLTLKLNTDDYKNGVIYRSDYDVDEKKYFNWIACDTLDSDGDPTIGATSVVYIIRYQDPYGEDLPVPEWYKAYVRAIDNKDDPSELTLWLDSETEVYPSTDQFFLFGYNSANGYLGGLENLDESALLGLRNTLRIASQDHNVVFTNANPNTVSADDIIDYGWLWYFDNGSAAQPHDSMLFFCYKTEGDTTWKRVYFDNNEDNVELSAPAVGEYFYNWQKAILYRRASDGTWTPLTAGVKLETEATSENVAAAISETTVASQFGTVYAAGQTRDRYYLGVKERIVYTVPSGQTLPIGRYYFEDDYGTYYTFITTNTLTAGDTLTYHYMSEDVLLGDYIIQNASGTEATLAVKNYRFDNVNYHKDNILDNAVMEAGDISTSTGEIDNSSGIRCRLAGYTAVYPDTLYRVDNLGAVDIHFYTEIKRWIKAETNVGATFKTPGNARYIKYVFKGINGSTGSVQEYDANIQNPVIAAVLTGDPVIIENGNYYKLETSAEGQNIGIIDFMKQFATAANDTYSTAQNAVKDAREALKNVENIMTAELGDIYKEGYWQDDSYIDGDEVKLYDDALDNLEKISYPETSYDIDFLDPYESNPGDADYCVAGETLVVPWEDFDISTAAHLVDPEIGINTWGFIDKIQKCYDKPYQTKIAINTNLTTIAQHSFADVMTNIANVANTVKGKISKYDTTSATYVPYTNYNDLLANLVTLTKITEKAGGRITEMENDITGHSSQIIQTANMISSEVSRAIASEAELRSQITQTESSISLMVEDEVRLQTETAKYRIVINSNYGNFLSANTPQLTLTPVVRTIGYNNGTKQWIDVTSQYQDQYYTWTRSSGNSANDNTWNSVWLAQHSSSGSTRKTITIDRDDMVSQATFVLTVEIDGEPYRGTFAVTNIDSVGVLEVYLAATQSAIQKQSISTPVTYTPDWSETGEHLVITPSVYLNGSLVEDQSLSIKWKKRYADGTLFDISTTLGENLQGDVLEVSKNVLGDRDYISYVCTATYNGLTASAEKAFSALKTDLAVSVCQIYGVQVFKYDSAGNPFYETIDLVAHIDGCSLVAWQYKDANNNWVQYPGSSTINSITVYESDPVFVNDVATIQVITAINNDSGPTDIFSIHKVRDNSSAIVFLSDESISFKSDENGNVKPGEYRTNVVAYEGKTQVVPVLPENFIINRAKIMPGMVITVENANEDHEVPILITVPDDQTYNFGSSGDLSGFIEFEVDSPIVTTLRLNWTKTRSATEGISSITTYYAKWYTNESAPARRKLAKFDEDGTLVPPIGDDYAGYTPVLGSMVLGAQSYWSLRTPTIDSFEKYLWAYDVITYVNGDVELTDPRVIGALGNSGMTLGINMPNGEVFDQYTTELVAEAYLFSGTDDISRGATFNWAYYYNGAWHDIDESTNRHVFTLNWLKHNCAGGSTIRCKIRYNLQDYFSYSNIIDKTGNIQPVIFSSGGDVFYNGIGSATLRCIVNQDGRQIDDDATMFNYSWTRLDKNGQAIDSTPISTNKQIQITASPLDADPDNEVFLIADTTTYVCYIEDKEGVYSAQAQLTVSCSINIVYSDTEPETKVPNLLWMKTGGEEYTTYDQDYTDKGYTGYDEDNNVIEYIDALANAYTFASEALSILEDNEGEDELEGYIDCVHELQQLQSYEEPTEEQASRIAELQTEISTLQSMLEIFSTDIDDLNQQMHTLQAANRIKNVSNYTAYMANVDLNNTYMINYSDTEPADPDPGDLWMDTHSHDSSRYKLYQYETDSETEESAWRKLTAAEKTAVEREKDEFTDQANTLIEKLDLLRDLINEGPEDATDADSITEYQDMTSSLVDEIRSLINEYSMISVVEQKVEEVANPLYRWDGDKFVEVTVPQSKIQYFDTAVKRNQANIEILSTSITQHVGTINSYVNEVNQHIVEQVATDVQQTNDKIEWVVSEQTSKISNMLQQETEERKTWMRFDKNFLELGRDIETYDINYSDVEPSRPSDGDLWMDTRYSNNPDDYILYQYSSGMWNALSSTETQAILENRKFKARLTNTKLSFMEDDAEIAYYANRQFYITEGRITNTFNIGSANQDMPGWYQYHMEKDGLAMTWKAEEYAVHKFKAYINYYNEGTTTKHVNDYTGYFLFLIRETNAQWVALSDSRNAYSEILTNNFNDYMYFKSLTFDRVGTRYFTISQVEGGVYGDQISIGGVQYYTDPGTQDDIVIYDKAQYRIRVHVDPAYGRSTYEMTIENIEKYTPANADTGTPAQTVSLGDNETVIQFTNYFRSKGA